MSAHSLNCPSCGKSENTVLETRRRADGIRRRRKCYRCDHRFWTVENILSRTATKRALANQETGL